ncbi:MAG: hypothetical protein ABTQ32_35640, partial [Myxococcaceae bacterium]
GPSVDAGVRDGGNVCPADVMMCPNGGFVSRTGPNCTFPACPGTNVDGGSALQCGPNTVCPMGLTCLATGFCGTATTCGGAICGAGQVCINNNCTVPQSCMTDRDCVNMNQTCQAGICR